jgi:hypothetical protein
MATIDAQAQAAMTTLNFIRNVGFEPNGDALMVQFVYNVTNATSGEVEENIMDVPFITILPIPFLEVSGRLPQNDFAWDSSITVVAVPWCRCPRPPLSSTRK